MDRFKFFLIFGFTVLLANFAFAQEPELYVKTTKSSVIRVDSTTGAEIIAEVPAGTVLKKVSSAYDWYKVQLPRTSHAYVFAKYISDESKCTATKLNMRHKADPASYVLGFIRKDQKVTILDTKGKWYKIRAYPFGYGWIHSKRVVATSETLAIEKKVEIRKATAQEITVNKPKKTTAVKPEPAKKTVKVEKAIVKKPTAVKLEPAKKTVKVEKAIVKKPIAKVQTAPKIKKLENVNPKPKKKKIVKKESKKIDISDLDAIINKHKKLKKKISKEVDLSLKEVKTEELPEPVAETVSLEKVAPKNTEISNEPAPFSGKLKKARRTATPAKFKLVHKAGYTLLHIPDRAAVKQLINKNVDVWGEEVEEGPYTYVVVKRIKKVD